MLTQSVHCFPQALDRLVGPAAGIGLGSFTPAPEHEDAGPQFLAKVHRLLQGTLDLLILRTIALEPMHGWAIANRIQQVSKDVLQVQQGSLYPALHRLEHQGWIQSEWGASDNNRRAKFYELTARGRRQIHEETASWQLTVALMAKFLAKPTGER